MTAARPFARWFLGLFCCVSFSSGCGASSTGTGGGSGGATASTGGRGGGCVAGLEEGSGSGGAAGSMDCPMFGAPYPCQGGVVTPGSGGAVSSSSGGARGSGGTGEEPVTCVVGRSYCSVRSQQKQVGVLPTHTCVDLTNQLAVCADKPTCACICGQGVICQSNCSCVSGHGEVTVSCLQI